MQVETYEVEESTQEAALLAADSEAIELINKLGLKGQQSLSNNETVERMPYRRMTQEEFKVYGFLFPTKTPLAEYRDGLIPIRVLQVAAHALEIGFFIRLEIWHPASATIKDPLLVGIAKGAKYSWEEEIFLLARWGDVLESLDDLAQLAMKKWAAIAEGQLMEIIAKAEGELKAIARIRSASAIPTAFGVPTFQSSMA